MKIAFDGQLLLKGDWTGIAWNAHNLVLELLKYPENECTLQYFRGRQASGQADRLAVYRKAGCKIEYCGWFGYTFYKLAWIVFPVPYRLFFRKKADITQFFNYAVPPGARGKRVTFIYDMSYRACPQTSARKTRLWLEFCMKKTCRHADHILTISEFSKDEIIKYLNICEEKISVVPCAVDHTVFHPGYTQGQIDEVRRKYAVGQDYFLYLGTIEPRKNLGRLIRAYAKLCQTKRNVPQLVLAGRKGWLCEGIYKMAQELNMGNRILFTGYVAPEESPLLMCGAKAFLFPSLYEGFGMPPLEAMACGTPVVVSNTASLPEITGGAGVLVDPQSVKEIYAAMKKIMEDGAYRDRLRSAGIKRAKEYTWEKSAKMLMEAYRKI